MSLEEEEVWTHKETPRMMHTIASPCEDTRGQPSVTQADVSQEKPDLLTSWSIFQVRPQMLWSRDKPSPMYPCLQSLPKATDTQYSVLICLIGEVYSLACSNILYAYWNFSCLINHILRIFLFKSPSIMCILLFLLRVVRGACMCKICYWGCML